MTGLIHHSRRRAGFSLIEIVVAATILAILAAVAMPTLTGYIDQQRADAAAAVLTAVRDAIYNPASGATAFYQRIGANPGELSQLVEPLTTADRNSCGSSYTTTQRNTSWPTYGPFMNTVIDATNGLPLPIGNAENDLDRSSTIITVSIPTVTIEDANRLDASMDNGDGSSGGAIRWGTEASNGTVTVSYRITTANHC